jgi:DNA-binding GntR family transcriptional regulator
LERGLLALIDAPRSAKWSAETRRLDSGLHELIAQRCGNERLAYEIGRYSILYRVLRDARHRRRAARANYAQMEENSEHLAIVRALTSGDPETAAAAMAAHVNQATAALEQDLFARSQIEADLTEPFLAKRSTATAAG